MGIFKRQTIGRSSLTKEDIIRLIDLKNPYRTDYSYVRSRSYRKDGSTEYENPRMDRFPLNYYKRKWALEEAWKSGVLTYVIYYMMDFCGQMAGSQISVFKPFYRVFYFFFASFLPQQRRKFYDLSTSVEELSNSQSYYESSNVSSRQSTLSRLLYRSFLTLMYIVTLGHYPSDHSSSGGTDWEESITGSSLEHGRISRTRTSNIVHTVDESQRINVLDHLDRAALHRSEKRYFAKSCGRLCCGLVPLLLIFLVAGLFGSWFVGPNGDALVSSYIPPDLQEHIRKGFQEGKEVLWLFAKSFIDTASELPSNIRKNASLRFHSFCEFMLLCFRRLNPLLIFNSTVLDDYTQKVSSIINGGSTSKDETSFTKAPEKSADLYRLLSDKELWIDQLTELRRERELNQEQFEELKKYVELVQNKLPVSAGNGVRRSLDGAVLDEETFSRRVEKAVIEKLIDLKEHYEKKETLELESSLLRSEFDSLSKELHEQIAAKFDFLEKDVESGRKKLANEIADLGASFAVLLQKYESLKESRNVGSNDGESISFDGQMKTKFESELKDFVTKQIIQEVETRLSAQFEESEASLRFSLLNELKSIAYDTFEKSKVEDTNTRMTKVTSSENSGVISISDYGAIKLMIKEALKMYDADKTGKVDYALESSGGSILSTRCTESYEKSRLESLFGFPLWYSSYSPRLVIQHRASLGSGECWAFRGTGYLVIKLAYPVYVTEVSYEHLPTCIHPEQDIKSSPRHFEIWSLREVNDLSSKFLIGEYEYDSKGEALQTFKAQNIPDYPSSIVELIVHSNWGADYTCLYRLRVHGQKAINATVRTFPQVDPN